MNIEKLYSEQNVTDIGVLRVADADTFLKVAEGIYEPRDIFNGMLYEGECSILFADTNSGKSILAVQIALNAAHELGMEVVYFDLELSTKQFAQRYADSNGTINFPRGFHRAEINYERLANCNNFEETIMQSIEMTAINRMANFIVVDNITFLCLQSETGADAGALMLRLLEIKRRLGITMLIVAHTPKRQLHEPLTQNSLAGSKRLANFADSIFAIGRSAKGENMRYIKQIKSRNSSIEHGADNVIVAEIDRHDNMLQFATLGCAHENEHLRSRPSSAKADATQVLALHAEGLSMRDIAAKTNLSHMTVQRIIKRS